MSIETLIAQYGLAAIFVGAGLEGETSVVTGGLLAHEGLLSLGGTALAAVVGSFAADQLFFFAGRRYRDTARVRRIRAKPAFAKALDTLDRHPTVFILSFRFLYGLRTISPIAIGTSPRGPSSCSTRSPRRCGACCSPASAICSAIA